MNTFKVVRIAKRGDKLPLEFKQEWIELHGQLKRSSNRVTVGIARGEKAPFDGMAAMYYSSAAKAKETLIDHPQRQEVACEEFLAGEKIDAAKTIKQKEQIKIVRTIFRHKDLSVPQFRDYWLKNYAKLEKRLALETPVLRVVASFALPPEPGGNEPAFDGMEEIYVSSATDVEAMLASPIPALMRKEEESFVQLDSPLAVRLMVEESVL
ncbi:MAG TPA: EthD domain-containing protein [Burkholderiales bacterium]|nr:EthD domain-containing protein [Burkholderiales bacterium]